jgi:hypothetical protein
MKRVGDIISALFDERLMTKARGYSKLFDCWEEITKKNAIAAAVDHSRLKNLDRGLLLVEADHPGWIQILQTKEQQILADFRYRFPGMDITGISFMLSRPRPHAETNVEAEPNKTETEQIEKIAELPPAAPEQNEQTGYEAIKDGSFKESLKRLEHSIAAKKK